MGLHDGHRARKKEQFRRQGLDGFADHEVLELLLYYAIPRKDTNEIAHRLLQKFGSLQNVFSAPLEELSKVDGVGESAALLYTAGFGLVLNDFVTALHSSSATLTVALYVYANDRGRTDVAFSIASVLMLLTLVINLTAALTGRKLKKNGGTQ